MRGEGIMLIVSKREQGALDMTTLEKIALDVHDEIAARDDVIALAVERLGRERRGDDDDAYYNALDAVVQEIAINLVSSH